MYALQSDASTLAGPFVIDVDTRNNTVSGSAKKGGSNEAVSSAQRLIAGGVSAVALLGAVLV